MSSSPVLAEVRNYYSGRLKEHGPTPRGVDWNSVESQVLRFDQLLKVCDLNEPVALGDYGCGYAALLEHVRSRGFRGNYLGYDIAPNMVEAARARHTADGQARFATEEAILSEADYVLASGILNVKLAADVADWERHLFQTLDRLAACGRRGFAFNVLTSYSDPEKQRKDLYYADPCRLFDWCKRQYSRHVALLHDYGLYEFTILVRQ